MNARHPVDCALVERVADGIAGFVRRVADFVAGFARYIADLIGRVVDFVAEIIIIGIGGTRAERRATGAARRPLALNRLAKG